MNFDFRVVLPRVPSANKSLGVIELAQLIRPAEDTEPAYLFKHALVQDTAYASLMRHDRRRLHLLVGEALERSAPNTRQELAPLLAHHFSEAGETARSLVYLRLAGDTAAARFANREALLFYTQALDAAEDLRAPECSYLHRSRGLVYERIGEFDKARADLERALQLARERSDSQAEWQSLIDLGFAWSARDYTDAAVYFERALELARTGGDPRLIAYSLNRVGNWHANNDEPTYAQEYHQEALNLFEGQHDAQGLAETEDLLGMSNLIGSRFDAARGHFDRSLKLFETLDDRRGYVSALMTRTLQAPSLQSETLLPAASPDLEGDMVLALAITRDLGWRAGEAYNYWLHGTVLAARGEYGRALEFEEKAMRVSREIDHRQWLAASSMLYGALLLELYSYTTAHERLADSLLLAREIDSWNWMRSGGAFFARYQLAQNDVRGAQATLDTVLKPDTPARTLGQRMAWAVSVELALAQNEPERALELVDLLIAGAGTLPPGAVIPRLAMYRAEAFMQQERDAEAEPLLRAALDAADREGRVPFHWQIRRLLAKLYARTGRTAEAAQQQAAARETIEKLAATVNDEALRAQYRGRALESITLS